MTNKKKDLANKEKKRKPIKLLLGVIAAVALLVTNIETIENFIWPDKKTCDVNKDAILVTVENLKGFDPVYFEQKTIDDIQPLLKTYFEHKPCKSKKVDKAIFEINNQLTRMVNELLDSLRLNPDEKNKSKLSKCLEILKFTCSQEFCSDSDKNKIDELIKTIQ